MSTGQLTERQIEILRILRDKATVENKRLFDQILGNALPKSDIESVCQLINNEYLMYGIKEDYNPTEYGCELEGILNAINSSRLA